MKCSKITHREGKGREKEMEIEMRAYIMYRMYINIGKRKTEQEDEEANKAAN